MVQPHQGHAICTSGCGARRSGTDVHQGIDFFLLINYKILLQIKNKGRVFNVPYGEGQKGKEVPCSSGQALKENVPAEVIDLTSSPSPSPPPTMAPPKSWLKF